MVVEAAVIESWYNVTRRQGPGILLYSLHIIVGYCSLDWMSKLETRRGRGICSRSLPLRLTGAARQYLTRL